MNPAGKDEQRTEDRGTDPMAVPLSSVPLTEPNYLNVDYGVKSWLLTTDHKRIALLYLVSITVMFFLGGIFIAFVRIHLMTPQGTILDPDTYNKFFTMHGIIMVFFFLVPVVPAVLGNFLLPHDDRGQGPGLSAAQPARAGTCT